MESRMSAIASLNLLGHDRLLVLTGAGISVESGLRAFRGADGLWEGRRIEDVATPDGFRRDPDRVWTFYSGLRHLAATVEPNAAHLALAACEERLGERYLLTTQNIDGLHQRAGSRRVFELHGSLWRTRCSGCDRPPFPDRSEPQLAPPCERCGASLRPAIVWFGEPVDVEADWRTKEFIKAAARAHERLVFLAIGTSGAVWPASGYARYAADFGAETWLANLDLADNEGDFAHLATGAATEVVPTLLGI
jgi:NAD-dependent deacetylase